MIPKDNDDFEFKRRKRCNGFHIDSDCEECRSGVDEEEVVLEVGL